MFLILEERRPGFPTGVENMGGGVKLIHGECMVGLKIMSKNTCEVVHLIAKLPAISLQACKFTKNELFHTFFKDFSYILSYYILYFF